MEWTQRVILRPVQSSDLEGVYHLACKAGTGMTNLPADKNILREKIQNSIQSFRKNPKKPGNESYFFVLVDKKMDKVVGCCAIFASVGKDEPFYSFHVFHEKSTHNRLEIRNDNLFLQLVNDYVGVTEIGSLFLMPRYRKNRLGEFLSRARYLFIAQHPNRFHDTVIAEMRGVLNRAGRSPFWQALGKCFINSNFKEADRLTAAHDNQFIGELIPHTPIPVALLDKRAQACIGKPHDLTRAAVRLLESEGFSGSHYIDVFDGGPTYEAKTAHIRSVATLRTMKVAGIKPTLEGPLYICANTSAPFRACLGVCAATKTKVLITESLADDLGVAIGDTISFVLF